jgi:hypothetical protein
MAAATGDWDLGFMVSHFGWQATIAVLINANSVGAAVPRRTGPHEHCAGDTGGGGAGRHRRRAIAVPGRRGGVAHDPPVFLGLFLFFPVFAAGCERHHDRLIPREALRVAFFLAGRVVLWTPTPGSSAPSR